MFLCLVRCWEDLRDLDTQLCQSPFKTQPIKSPFSPVGFVCLFVGWFGLVGFFCLLVFGFFSLSPKVNAFKALSSPSRINVSKPLMNCGVILS